MRRLPTLAFGRACAPHLEAGGAKFSAALDLALIVDPLETMDTHEGARFFLLGAYQTMKSLVGQLRMLRNHRVRPSPALWYCPTDDFGKDFADTKLNPLLESVPALRDLVDPDKARPAKLRRSFVGGGSHLVLSASTDNDRHGKTARDLYLDEVHLYEPGWIDEISARRGAYPDDFTETFMSTGLVAGTDAARIWEMTDRRIWHWRCPACRRLFEPRMLHYDEAEPAARRITGGLRWERRDLPDGGPDLAHLAATLRYECPHCHASFPDTPGSRAQFSGTSAAPRGLWISANPAAKPRHFGWNFNALSVRPWLDVAEAWEIALRARERADLGPLRKVILSDLAGIWDEREYVREARHRPAGGYKLGEPWLVKNTAGQPVPGEDADPNGDPYRIAAVDVQQDHFVVVIRAWNRRSQSRLVWAEKVTTASRLHDLATEHRVIPSRVVLDRRHTPQRVRHLCAQFGWRSLMGENDRDYLHPDGLRRIFSPPQSLDPFLGTAHQGQAVIVENNFAKWSAMDRLALLRTLETPSGEPLFTAADDAPEWYLRELDAYYRVKKIRGNGVEFFEWQSRGADHAADCECMGIAVASALGLTGVEATTPPPNADDEPCPAKTNNLKP